METIFHKIIKKEIPAKILFEDEDVIAFEDIQAVAPVHFLVVPKIDLESLSSASLENALTLGKVMLACKKVADLKGLNESGYRVVINSGEGVGQSVFQLHAHVIGGRELKWPPG